MFRFTIRDVLWLMVVVAMTVGWWADQRTTTNLARDLKSRRQLMDKEWKFLLRTAHEAQTQELPLESDLRSERERFLREQTPDLECERSKQKSIELGAPKPKPLPPGYGERPNST
jgi:hypothetical protein